MHLKEAILKKTSADRKQSVRDFLTKQANAGVLMQPAPTKEEIKAGPKPVPKKSIAWGLFNKLGKKPKPTATLNENTTASTGRQLLAKVDE